MAEAYGLDQWLEMFESDFKLIEFLSTDNINVYVPSLEFIVFTKIKAQADEESRENKRRAGRDINDISFVKDEMETFNFNKLGVIIDGYFSKFASEKEKKEFTKTYESWIDWLHD